MYLKGAKYVLLGSLFLVLAFFTNPEQSLAQTIGDSSVSTNVTPSNYGANENVNVLLTSYSENLDTVLISWFLNGRSAGSGIGLKSFSTVSGALGTDNTVLVKIALPLGEVQKTINIRPNSSVLLWQAMDSRVPPFYKGKALPSGDSLVKVVSMPEIKIGSAIIDPKSLVYSWRKDYSNEAEDSGYGKNSFTYINDFLENSNTIEVTASTLSGERSSTSSLALSTFSPEISFYKKSDSLGIDWDNAITDGYFIKNKETLVAVPYFISPKDIRRPDLVFNWFINGGPITISSLSKNSLPLAVQEGTTGTSSLKLNIENKYKIFQNTEKEINLNF